LLLDYLAILIIENFRIDKIPGINSCSHKKE
jgi:hypothetical protein